MRIWGFRKLRIYRKIPKISPGAYIFHRPFLRGLFLDGLIYGGKFASQNRFGYPYSWKQIYRFCFFLLCIGGQFAKYKPAGGLYLEGRFNGGFLRCRFWGVGGGAYIWRGLYMEGLIFGILRYFRWFYFLGNFYCVMRATNLSVFLLLWRVNPQK